MFRNDEIIEFKKYCHNLAKDNLLFQGAGGNVSLKDEKILMIKASGKWMKNICKEEIFVNLDLKKLLLILIEIFLIPNNFQ